MLQACIRAQAQREQAVFSSECREVGEMAGSFCIAASWSFARRCGLFICGFDMFVFFFFLGQGGGGCDAGTENRKLKISTGY